MRKLILTTVLIFSVIIGFSQTSNDTLWRKGTTGNITFSQVALSNWAAGGENSYSTDFFFNFFANYMKGKSTWDNTLKLAYGVVKISDEDIKKSNDQIDFESRYGYAASKNWSYSTMFNFKSQFWEGFDYENNPDKMISNFMAPGYFLLSLGMDYHPMKKFSVLISPITAKATYVLDDDLSDEGAYGVDPGENSLYEYGAFLKAKLEKLLFTDVNLVSSLDLFTSYNNNPGNIDVSWETLIDMKINKYLSANIRTHLIYDDDIKIADEDGNKKPRVQFKEAFGIGISYKIGN